MDRIGWMALRKASGLGPIIASTSARYRRPLSYPDRIAIGVRVKEMQFDRIVVEYRIVSETWNAIAADGEAVVVSYDYNAGKKCPVPEIVKQHIEAMGARGA
jgi:acyl-CoA thioester hydrolase